MHFTTLFTSLTSLLTIAVAIPVAQAPPQAAPAQTPTTPKQSPTSAAAAQVSHLVSPTPVGAYSCPPQQFKKCCQSVEQTSKEIMQGLGQIVPILGGVQVSSKISFQCNPMTPEEAPDSCNDDGYSPMCCGNGSSDGISTCEPFKDVKEQYYRSFGYGQESQVDMINDAVA